MTRVPDGGSRYGGAVLGAIAKVPKASPPKAPVRAGGSGTIDYWRAIREYGGRKRFSVEKLPNGYVRVFDRSSKSTGLYHPDGRKYSSQLRLPSKSQIAQDLMKRPR